MFASGIAQGMMNAPCFKIEGKSFGGVSVKNFFSFEKHDETPREGEALFKLVRKDDYGFSVGI